MKKVVRGESVPSLMSMSTNTKMHLVHETETVEEEVNLDSVSWVLGRLQVEGKSNGVSLLTP